MAGTPAKRRIERPMTAKRRETFLEVLRKTGIFRAAARAASPDAPDGAASTFRDLMRRDPEFAAAVEDARQEADELLEQTAWERAVQGVPEPVFQRGERALDADGSPAVVRRYSDRLLERLLEARLDKFVQRRELHHVGHSGGDNSLRLTVDDLRYLSPAQKDHLADVLRTISERRGDAPAPLADKRADAVDAEFTEADDLPEDEQSELEEVLQ